MALFTCSDCKTEISDKSAACVRCGAPVTKQHHDAITETTGVCPNCNSANPLDAHKCLQCGALFAGEGGWKLKPHESNSLSKYNGSYEPPPAELKKSASTWWMWALGVPVGLFLAMLAFGTFVNSTPEGKARADKRATIDLCWQEQSKKSIDPASGRFVAGVCEKLEAEYKR